MAAGVRGSAIKIGVTMHGCQAFAIGGYMPIMPNRQVVTTHTSQAAMLARRQSLSLTARSPHMVSVPHSTCLNDSSPDTASGMFELRNFPVPSPPLCPKPARAHEFRKARRWSSGTKHGRAQGGMRRHVSHHVHIVLSDQAQAHPSTMPCGLPAHKRSGQLQSE